MKKHLLFVLCLGLWMSQAAQAQVNFSDDFEAYSAGAFIGSVGQTGWTTWSNAPGGAEDAPISTEQANSGTKSLKLVSTSTAGGPDDVVLNFGQKYTLGDFHYEMYMWVTPNHGTYFNFQAETTIGATWANNVYFRQDGTVSVDDGNGVKATSTFPFATWFKVSFDMDLTANVWSFSLDDELIGTWSNTVNSIASIDLYPLNQGTGLSTAYIDDVAFSHTPFVPVAIDAGVISVDLRPKGLTGQTRIIKGKVRNLGTTAVTSVTLEMTSGGNTSQQMLTGLNLPFLGFADYEFPTPFTYAAGNNDVQVKIVSVNGSTDMNANNNTRNAAAVGITPAPGKMVLVEEATGTWCPWCPRGAVFLDLMTDLYPDHFVGIAVHNDDPMTVVEHDAGVTAIPGFTGFPSVVLDRAEVVDPSDVEDPFFDYIQSPVAATLKNGAKYEASTRKLELSVEANFLQNLSGDYRLNMILVEDGVTGTTTGYRQANAYANGTTVMGGYELLPNPVPAAQMVYDHVSRAILGGFAGAPGSLPSSINSGDTHKAFFSLTLADDIDFDNLKLVGMVLNPDGTVHNVFENTIVDAILEGLAVGTNDFTVNFDLQVGPNPTQDILNVRMALNEMAPVTMTMFNELGQAVVVKQLGNTFGVSNTQISTTQLPNGIYSLEVQVGNQRTAKKLVVQH